MIEFHTDEELKDIIPHPKPASHFFPKWYKDMPADSDPKDANSGTMKRCIPVRDAITMGYIIPLWTDVEFNPQMENVAYQSSERFGKPAISEHGEKQVSGCPLAENNDYGHHPLKFESPWIIKTPPGYSTMFISPIGHFEDRFELITAVVDTDTYYNVVNFPFIWKSRKHTILKKGEPIVQAIPFKREDWESENSYSVGVIEDKEQLKTIRTLGTHLKDAYKEEYWKPQRFR